MALRCAAMSSGNLAHANVLEVPGDRLFEVLDWKSLASRNNVLNPLLCDGIDDAWTCV
ncbi:MAG: hypothetical protein QUS33_05695 [Dehalococcoidia bacterium]|nr:hypothetical protein [Dehalococcoidia bacterium]